MAANDTGAPRDLKKLNEAIMFYGSVFTRPSNGCDVWWAMRQVNKIPFVAVSVAPVHSHHRRVGHPSRCVILSFRFYRRGSSSLGPRGF